MQLKIVSFNLRYDKPDPGNNAWKVRRQSVAALISQYAPDIIGTQEGLAHQLYDLQKLLPDYKMVGCDRLGNGLGEYCAILYHKRLNCTATGDFFLSNTPEIPGSISPEWGNPVPRMTTWAEFVVADVAIAVFNTHLDYESSQARELASELICDRISNLDAAKSFVFLTGDFNAIPETLPRNAFLCHLSNGIQLLDALANVELERQMTFHDFTGKAFAAVDTIYYDSRVTLLEAKVDTSSHEGILPSDHFPAIACFAIPEQ